MKQIIEKARMLSIPSKKLQQEKTNVAKLAFNLVRKQVTKYSQITDVEFGGSYVKGTWLPKKADIHSHKSKNAYRRQLNQNLSDESSWFYLNKQAAFANVVALCSESEESPLGPIKIILNSKNIDIIIEWLIFNQELTHS